VNDADIGNVFDTSFDDILGLPQEFEKVLPVPQVSDVVQGLNQKKQVQCICNKCNALDYIGQYNVSNKTR